jgi:hypothetical protein
MKLSMAHAENHGNNNSTACWQSQERVWSTEGKVGPFFIDKCVDYGLWGHREFKCVLSGETRPSVPNRVI